MEHLGNLSKGEQTTQNAFLDSRKIFARYYIGIHPGVLVKICTYQSWDKTSSEGTSFVCDMQQQLRCSCYCEKKHLQNVQFWMSFKEC